MYVCIYVYIHIFLSFFFLVAQYVQLLAIPIESSPPGSSVHGIPQARILEWVDVPFSRGSSWPRDQTWVSRIVGRSFTIWATRKVQLSDLIIIASFRRKGKRAILWLSRHSYLWGALANVHANPQAHYGGRRPEQTQRILCLQILFYQL